MTHHEISTIVNDALELLRSQAVRIVTHPKDQLVSSTPTERFVGVEWTSGEKKPVLNIDPQHAGGTEQQPVSACRYILENAKLVLQQIHKANLHPSPENPVVLATSRLDPDSAVGIAFLMALLARGEGALPLLQKARDVVEKIDFVDVGAAFAARQWRPRLLPLDSLKDLEDELIAPKNPVSPLESTIAPLAMMLTDAKLEIVDRFKKLYDVLQEGLNHSHLQPYHETYVKQRMEFAYEIYAFFSRTPFNPDQRRLVLEASQNLFTETETRFVAGVLPIVESTLNLEVFMLNDADSMRLLRDGRAAIAFGFSRRPGITSILYSFAPIIVACNPQMDFKGVVGPKYTVARFNSSIPVDLRKTQNTLNQLEQGWGGSENIIGSPQDRPSSLTLMDVLKAVAGSIDVENLSKLLREAWEGVSF